MARAATVVAMLALFPFLSARAQPTTAPTMPADVLAAIDRAELGPAFDPSKANLYADLHRRIEAYFAAHNSDDRKAAAESMGELNLDPNLVGRLTRVHLDWAALAPGPVHVEDKVGPVTVDYYLGVPKAYDRAARWPLIVLLPSIPPGEVKVGYYTERVSAELERHPGTFILIPTFDPNSLYGPSYAGMNRVMDAMRHATSRANVDPARVALAGSGISAPAVWNLGLHYGTYFAGIAPFAGFADAEFQRVRLMNLRNTRVVAWHDYDDKVIKVAESRQLTDILKRMKFDVTYTETRGGGHEPGDAIVQQALDRLVAKPRDLYPGTVSIQSDRPDTILNRLDWVQMYQPTRPGEDRRLNFRHGGYMATFFNPMSIKATVANNRIDADAENVESMRFYLNDQMVDFSKPITLRVNGRVRFQGMLKPNGVEMLKDQLVLGRGWRYFTAHVDVDFGEPATKPTTAPGIKPQ